MKPLISLTLLLAGILVLVGILIFGRRGADTETPVIENKIVVTAQPTFRLPSSDASSVLRLRELAHNPSVSSAGATASYELRLAVADRLTTNETFRRWATNAVTTAACNLASRKEFHIHGANLMNSNSLQIEVGVAISGLRGEAVFDSDTNSRGPITFVVEGGTNPTVTMVRDPYGMATYQLNPSQAGSSSYPRHVARMDWGEATSPMDTSGVEAAARAAYFAMTGAQMPDGLQAKIDAPTITDPMVSDPSVQVTGNPNATVATVNNQRFPFVDFEFVNPASGDRILSGEMVQSSAGTGEFVELFTTQSRFSVQNSIIDLGQMFLSPSGEWAQDVLSGLGTTSQEEVLKRVWKIPNR